MPLSDYLGVVQTTTNSCGAFALAAALAELEKVEFRLNVDNLSEGFNRPYLSPLEFAESIYQITGCLELDFSTREAVYQYTSPVSDMNPPSALVYKAFQYLKNSSRIEVNYNSDTQKAFETISVTNLPPGNLLQIEKELIGSEYGRVFGPANYQGGPINNHIHLLLVGNYDHWITITETQLYDSADGFVGSYKFKNIEIIEANNSIYTLCGLWIVLA